MRHPRGRTASANFTFTFGDMGAQELRFRGLESQRLSDSRRSLPKTGHRCCGPCARCLEFDMKHAQHSRARSHRIRQAEQLQSVARETSSRQSPDDSVLGRCHSHGRWRHHRYIEQSRARHRARQLDDARVLRCTEGDNEQESDHHGGEHRPGQRVARGRGRLRRGIGRRHRRTMLASGGCV